MAVAEAAGIRAGAASVGSAAETSAAAEQEEAGKAGIRDRGIREEEVTKPGMGQQLRVGVQARDSEPGK